MLSRQEMRQPWLPVADTLDRISASATRAQLHAFGAFARALHLKAPVPPVAGPATAHEVVSDGPLARVLRYPARGARKATPLLVVASLINRYYVLDLLPELSVIDGFCARGFEVYVLDWKGSGDLGPSLRFTDYIDGAIAAAAQAAGTEPVAMLGYCMGGTLATMFAARHPERVRALGLLGTPIDFHASGVLADWIKPDRFDVDLMIDACGNMPPALMQSGFKLMNPADAVFKFAHLCLDADDAWRVRHFVALESWLADNVAFPGGLYRAYIKELYQDNALALGRMRVDGEVVDLKKLTAPLLNILGLRDHICAPPSSRALMALCGASDQTLLEFETGHIGLSASRGAHQRLWPQVFDWFEARA